MHLINTDLINLCEMTILDRNEPVSNKARLVCSVPLLIKISCPCNRFNTKIKNKEISIKITYIMAYVIIQNIQAQIIIQCTIIQKVLI